MCDTAGHVRIPRRSLSTVAGRRDEGGGRESRYWTARAANELALDCVQASRHATGFARTAQRSRGDSSGTRTIHRRRDGTESRRSSLAATARASVSTRVGVLLGARLRQRDRHGVIPAAGGISQRRQTADAQSAMPLSQLQRADEAVPILKQLVERNPNDPRVKLALGRAYRADRQLYRDAIPLLEEQLDERHRWKPAHAARARVCRQRST